MGTIFDEYLEIRGRMIRGYMEPKRISFSEEGYREAMRENHGATVNLDLQATTYCGLPYEVRPQQTGRVALHDNAPGRRAKMTAAQLCDVIRDWLDADDATHWGDFEKELDAVVVRHGRFE